MKSILGLDPGTTTGWAHVQEKTLFWHLESGVQKFSLRHGESVGMRFIRFNAWIGEMIKILSPEMVVYEQPAGRMGAAAKELLYGFTTRIQEACEGAGITYTPCHISTLKMWATGVGNASKDAMVKEAYLRRDTLQGLSVTPERQRFATHDEADAILMALWAKDEGYRG